MVDLTSYIEPKSSLTQCTGVEYIHTVSETPIRWKSKPFASFHFSLLIISEITLFFDEARLEMSAGLTLTIMLVMYTMYQSIIETLAKTAYLKLIDYWLLFCLLMPFTTFMIEISWLLNPSRVEPFKRNKWNKRSFIQIIIPAVSVIFVLSYFLTAIVVMTF